MTRPAPFLAELLAPRRSTGTAILLVGGPGLGKSTVLAEAVGLARAAGYAVLPFEADQVRRTALERPVLVAIDDFDRLAPVSAAQVLAGAEALRDQPVVLLLTSRKPGRTGLPQQVLRPLGISAASELLRQQRTPVTGRARYEVLRRSGGNPQALLALSQAFSTGGAPDTADIQTQYKDDIEALPEQTRGALLYAASRLGRESLATVLAATRLHPRVWGPAVDAGLVEVGQDLTFQDPLFAVALYYAAPAAARRQVHTDLAAATDSASFESAMHRAMLPLGADEVTANLLEEQSWKARCSSRMAQATIAAQRAAELSHTDQDAVRRYLLAAAAATGAGDSAWSRELAAIVRRRTRRPELRYIAAIMTAAAFAREGRQHEAMDLLSAAVRGERPADRDIASSVALCAASVAAQSGLPQHLQAADEVVRAGAGAVTTKTVASFRYSKNPALQAAQTAVWLDQRRASEYKSLLLSHRDQVSGLAGIDVLALATIAGALGETEQAVALRWRVLRQSISTERVQHPEAWPALIADLLALGQWRQATAALQSADRLARMHDLTTLRVHVAALRATLLAMRGDAGGASALIDRVWSELDLSCNRAAHAQLLRAAGYAGLTAGDRAAAARNFTEALVMAGTTRSLPPDGLSALGLAMAARPTDAAAEAFGLVQTVRAAAGDEPPLPVWLLLSQAEALLLDDNKTEDRFRFTVDHPRARTWRPAYALACLHYGVWLRRRRRPMDARVYLAEALAAFTDLGAVELARFARGELAATDGDAGGSAASPAVALLSARQRQVARLAAAGLRNSQIAEQLQLSAHTINTHLQNVYLRLGITRRDQLRLVDGVR